MQTDLSNVTDALICARMCTHTHICIWYNCLNQGVYFIKPLRYQESQ